jgi:hypothetical protein
MASSRKRPYVEQSVGILYALLTLFQPVAAETDFLSVAQDSISGVVHRVGTAGQCTLLVTPDGRRFELRGFSTISDGALVTLKGKITPIRQPACRTPFVITGADDEPSPSQPAQQMILDRSAGEGQAFKYSGRVRKATHEGGCWRLDTDIGKSFELHGGGSRLYQDGLMVEVTGVPVNETASTCQVGSLLDVKSYRLSSKTMPAPRLSVVNPVRQ